MGLVHPTDAERTSGSINAAMQGGGGYQNELRLKRKDGKYRWFQDSGIIQLEDGAPVLAVGSIIDIHARKLAEKELSEKNKELEKTNEELDRFVYSASHDMRAPLSTLLGLVQLAEQNQDPKEYAKFFALMKRRIFTMEGFINEETDYSRNARLDIEQEEVNLSGLIEELVDTFQILAEEADIQVEVMVDPDLTIKTDPNRLKVVLNNLVSNAIKYIDHSKVKREVQIEARKTEFNLEIQIRDNGSGIDPKYIDKIFDMFFRASDQSDGSGLGLYIVKETVDRLGGIITCDSSKEGTTFTLRLPYSVKDPLAVALKPS